MDWVTSEELTWPDSRLAAPAATTTRGADVDNAAQRTTVGEQRVAGRPVTLLVRRARALAELTPCRQADPKLWFSESPADLERAKRLCRNCPVRPPCLAGAIDRVEPLGVWGARSFIAA